MVLLSASATYCLARLMHLQHIALLVFCSRSSKVFGVEFFESVHEEVWVLYFTQIFIMKGFAVVNLFAVKAWAYEDLRLEGIAVTFCPSRNGGPSKMSIIFEGDLPAISEL